MVLRPAADRPVPEALLGRVSLLLLRRGADGLPAALAAMVAGTGARSAVLRRTDDRRQVLATAGNVVQAVQAVEPRRRSAVAELGICAPEGRTWAQLSVQGASAGALPLLRDVAGLLGLLLPAPAVAAPAAAVTLLDREAERAELADRLHDGPLQDLVAARYAADCAVRAGADPAVRQAVQSALVRLRRLEWQLRPRGGDGLAAALSSLSKQLVEGGGQALVLQVDPVADVLPPPAAVVAYRLVQAVLGQPIAGATAAPVTVRLVRRDAPGGREVVALAVDGGAALLEPARWRRTAVALGGDLLCRPGRLRLALPLPVMALAPAAASDTPAVPARPPHPLAPTSKAVL